MDLEARREDLAPDLQVVPRKTDVLADQQFTIGVISGVPQPVVARTTLMNVPEKGFYNWDPGAFFGIYRPDTFWFAK